MTSRAVGGGMPDAQAVARIAMACGLEPHEVRPLGRGVTVIAWRVDTQRGPAVVRIALAERPASTRPHETVRFEAQFALLERLHALDPRVPQPYATSGEEDVDDPLEGSDPWMVTAMATGTPFDGAGSPPSVARELGALLRTLHGIDAGGWGLLEDRRDAIRGERADATEGVLSRWAAMWPFDGTPLVAHPVARLAPGQLGTLAPLREQLLRYMDVDARAVQHGDLHAEHVLVEGAGDDARLSGLYDFGDAFVGHPAWDIASFAHHHGWALTDALLEGYEPRRLPREIRLAEAQQLAVALALQKVHKYHVARPDAARLARVLAFLAETVPLATRRPA